MDKFFDDIRWDKDESVFEFLNWQTELRTYKGIDGMSIFAVAAYYGSITSLRTMLSLETKLNIREEVNALLIVQPNAPTFCRSAGTPRMCNGIA